MKGARKVNEFRGRYVFVAGLHRTGTSLLAGMLADHPSIAAIEDAPVPENEGCYLQGGIPHTALHGRPGHYATDPQQHLVEGCQYDTLATRRRIEADWSHWFSPQGCWRVEKSPVNLTRMRLYQNLFPTCQFVVILRHPAIMAAALAKWVDDAPASVIEYALDAYDLALDDLRHLHCIMVIRYEDLVSRDHLPALLAFLDLPASPGRVTLRDGNADYDAIPEMTASQRLRAERLGYGPAGEVRHFVPIVRHPLRAVREATLAALAEPDPR